jgi:hypothetical protein
VSSGRWHQRRHKERVILTVRVRACAEQCIERCVEQMPSTPQKSPNPCPCTRNSLQYSATSTLPLRSGSHETACIKCRVQRQPRTCVQWSSGPGTACRYVEVSNCCLRNTSTWGFSCGWLTTHQHLPSLHCPGSCQLVDGRFLPMSPSQSEDFFDFFHPLLLYETNKIRLSQVNQFIQSLAPSSG